MVVREEKRQTELIKVLEEYKNIFFRFLIKYKTQISRFYIFSTKRGGAYLHIMQRLKISLLLN